MHVVNGAQTESSESKNILMVGTSIAYGVFIRFKEERMKSLIVFALLAFTAQSQAITGYDQPRNLVICKNQMLQAKLETLADRKDVQLIVKDLRLDSLNNTVYSAVVHPVSGENMDLFINAQTSFRLAADGPNLKGLLTLNRNVPNVGQMLDCVAYYNIQPQPQMASLD